MLILLAILCTLLIVLCVGYWSTSVYPNLRPYRYNKTPDIHLTEAKQTMEHKTLAARYNLQNLVKGHLSDAERINTLCTWAHSLWRPSTGRHSNSENPLTILSRVANGERFSRIDYVTVIANAMMSVGIPTRIVSLNTRDCSWRPIASSYLGIEYFDRDHFKWAWLDAQFGIRILHDYQPLNSLEIKDAILNQEHIELEPDRLGIDIDQYMRKIIPFLDIVVATPIGQKRRFALIPPQIKILKNKWYFGKTIYDISCHSQKSFFASPPMNQLTTPIRNEVKSRITLAG